MDTYIIESMALVGCGVADTKEIANLVKQLPQKAIDVLDTWYNLGKNVELRAEYTSVIDMLNSQYSDDDITCLSAYVNAVRNVA